MTMTRYVGQVQAYTPTGLTVVVNGKAFPAFLGSNYEPQIAEFVLVWLIDDVAFVMAPKIPYPTQGTVVSVASGQVTLTVAGWTTATITCPYSANLSPTAGQVMQLMWANGPFAIAVISTTVVAPTPPASTAPTTGPHQTVFQANDSGSWNSSSWWTPNVYSSDSNVGAWFYGSKISDTIPATAQIQMVEVLISPVQISGAVPNFACHTSQTKPGGAPTFAPTAAVGVAPGWVTLPTSFGDLLKSGGGCFGLGADHGGYSIFKSVQQDGQSGALRITSVY